MDKSLEHLVQITKETIIATVEEILGPMASPAVDKIRAANDSPEGLHEAVRNCEMMTKSSIEPEKYNQIKVICSALLNDLEEAAKENARPAKTDEKKALKVRIVKAKLLAVTSKILGSEGLNVLDTLRAAPDNREGLLLALQECETIVGQSVNSATAEELKANCDEIINQLS